MRLFEIYFSPTGGTKKAADIIARAWNEQATVIDMIKKPSLIAETAFHKDDVCIIAMPSFGGRIPVPAAELLKKADGNGAYAVMTAVYGNRHIDDTLTELSDILKKRGFNSIAGIEAVAEHSLMRTYGAGRPDGKDEQELAEFTYKIKESLINGTVSKDPAVPGSHDYRSFNGVPLKPFTNNNCIGCGLCAAECPVHAISKENPRIIDKDICISCMHCLTVCPKKAKQVDPAIVASMTEKMKERCSGRKENRLYL